MVSEHLQKRVFHIGTSRQDEWALTGSGGGALPRTAGWRNVTVVLSGSRVNRATCVVELVGTSNKSECTRESEMRGAHPAFFHTAGEAGETDSTTRKCVPQPIAIAPARFHVSYFV